MEHATGNYYTINHVVLFTGLTDRTIRNYISSGLLKGEKINGLWHFTPEQVDAFVRHSAVWPSIQAKKNSIVYDFLLDTRKKTREACIIFDLPEADPKTTAEYFCDAIRNAKQIQFSFDSIHGAPRIILRGETAQVLSLVNGYCASKT